MRLILWVFLCVIFPPAGIAWALAWLWAFAVAWRLDAQNLRSANQQRAAWHGAHVDNAGRYQQ